MGDFRSSIKEMGSLFSEQLERRDRVLKDSRDVIAASSRAIIDVHTGKMKDAERELAAAKGLLTSLKKTGSGDASRYLVSPEAEYVEAAALISIAKGKTIPTRDSLGASPAAYLLGLLDTVGELKRLVLDSVMHRRTLKARRYFGLMEDIYSICSPMAVYDHVANGARRKIDVARMLVEDTRSMMTEEARRELLNASMARLERRLGRSAKT